MQAYLKLMRLHKPVGILLLWFPTAWALWLANEGTPPLNLVVLFLIGTILMRSAGCVMNDMADRQIDLHVERTKERPLARGDLTIFQAFVLLVFLLLGALVVLYQLPQRCFYYAVLAVLISLLYPFCKRFIQGPQFVLGLAFSMGIPMAFVASNLSLNKISFCLLLINFLWILAYDTEYAMVDREDDLRIGVKSTAILFGKNNRLIIAGIQVCFHLLWLVIAYIMQVSLLFFVLWLVAILPLIYQQTLLAKGKRVFYMQAFSSNAIYGLFMWLAIILA